MVGATTCSINRHSTGRPGSLSKGGRGTHGPALDQKVHRTPLCGHGCHLYYVHYGVFCSWGSHPPPDGPTRRSAAVRTIETCVWPGSSLVPTVLQFSDGSVATRLWECIQIPKSHRLGHPQCWRTGLNGTGLLGLASTAHRRCTSRHLLCPQS